MLDKSLFSLKADQNLEEEFSRNPLTPSIYVILWVLSSCFTFRMQTVPHVSQIFLIWSHIIHGEFWLHANDDWVTGWLTGIRAVLELLPNASDEATERTGETRDRRGDSVWGRSCSCLALPWWISAGGSYGGVSSCAYITHTPRSTRCVALPSATGEYEKLRLDMFRI